MKKIDWKLLLVTSSLFLIPLVLVSLYYGQLPAVLHTHFGADNVANQTSSKWMSLIFIPLLAFLFHVFLCIALDVTKNGQVPVVKVGKWVMPIVMTLVTTSILLVNLGNELDIRRLVVAFLAGVYLIMGNYMPKDVATTTASQTLADRKKTAYLFIGGAVALLLSLFFEPIVSIVVLIVFTISAIVWSMYCGYKGYKMPHH
ncbi:DUF1648 domain-containing protein [Streptococcus himalayensis]|uniref:Membrane protein n=1 Tax=Streptococcus himalayensis TaxID=1888195 RepID=A0A917A694_9STRE|nr:DUF1648 domain-containing protein [Streptococcus himalayensis]GGE30003.1 membrane protein [Streptococcus himalayensis]